MNSCQLCHDIKEYVNIQEEHPEGPWIERGIILDAEDLIDDVLGSLDNLVLFSDIIPSGAFVNAVIIVLLVRRNFLDTSSNDTGLGVRCFDL